MKRKRFSHVDLFSGIGGFALAAKWCWGDDYETVAFCDNNRFCQELLKLRFPGVPIINDIRELKYETFANANGIGYIHGQAIKQPTEAGINAQRNATAGDKHGLDLITGGFPCQPFSAAGKRKGTDDDRHLWPQMFRVISEFKPTWVIAENVRGLLSIEGGVVFQQVCLDLESIGYEVQPFVIPACAVNAPHRRDRVWIVAYSKLHEHRTIGGQGREADGIQKIHRQKYPLPGGINGTDCNAPNPSCGQPRQQTQRQGREDTGRGSGEDVANTDTNGLPNRIRRTRGGAKEVRTSKGRSAAGHNTTWGQNWLKVATSFCGVDDGLPAGVDGFKLSKSGHRVERLKSLGNAIVPQVAYQIMVKIREVGNGD